MNRLQKHQKAQEIIDVMKMWDISRDHALDIIIIMKGIVENTQPETWSNPLIGTGFKAVS